MKYQTYVVTMLVSGQSKAIVCSCRSESSALRLGAECFQIPEEYLSVLRVAPGQYVNV